MAYDGDGLPSVEPVKGKRAVRRRLLARALATVTICRRPTWSPLSESACWCMRACSLTSASALAYPRARERLCAGARAYFRVSFLSHHFVHAPFSPSPTA
eukprot:6186491-Pleurochrysis_carterae.AAC.2